MDERAQSQPSYCFHGGYERAVDAKGRFNLPFRIRRSGEEAGAERYVVMPGPDGQLNLLPEEVFEAAFNRLREGEPSREKRAVMRRISSSSCVLEPDNQGRVAVPAPMLASVGIGKRVYVVGLVDRIELFDPERYAIIESALGNNDPAYLDKFLS
jgi:MraZ protein